MQTADLLKKTDLIIGISLSGKTLELFESIKIAKEQKAQIITITSSDYSPLAQLSDINLQTVNEEFFDGGSLTGKISQLYICEILVKNHERLYKDKSIQSREAIIRAVMDKTVE